MPFFPGLPLRERDDAPKDMRTAAQRGVAPTAAAAKQTATNEDRPPEDDGEHTRDPPLPPGGLSQIV